MNNDIGIKLDNDVGLPHDNEYGNSMLTVGGRNLIISIV